MSICCPVQILEQAFFLLCQSILVCLAWIATQITLWIATIHCMPFGQSMRLFDVRSGHCARQMCSLGNFDLPGHSHIIFVTALWIDKFCLVVAHPPRPTARCTGLPAITGVPDFLDLPSLPFWPLASGCAAACFLDSASFNASVNFLGSVILLFTSLAYSITENALCVNEKGPCGPFV